MVAVLMAVTAFSPLCTFENGREFYLFLSYGYTLINTEIQGSLHSVNPIYGIASVAGLTSLMALVNIFLYKKRKLQIKIGYITIGLILFFYFTAIVYFLSITGHYENAELIGVKYGIILPIIALILNVMAISGIKKDEKLVKSLNRIR